MKTDWPLRSITIYDCLGFGTNYGKFDIRFSSAKPWNSFFEVLKSKSRFKKLLRESIIPKY